MAEQKDTAWYCLNAKRRQAMKWVAGLGHDIAVSPGAIGWLLAEGYLKIDTDTDKRLAFTEKGQAAWDSRPEYEKD